MKVFHIESGLGNQMLDYCDLMASRSVNPNDEFYIETIIYDCVQDTICMWQGYELERIFNIREKNVSELFTYNEWQNIIKSVNESKFWEHNWAYTEAINGAFKRNKLILRDAHPRVFKDDDKQTKCNSTSGALISKKKYFLRRMVFKFAGGIIENQFANKNQLFKRGDSDDYDGHYLTFKYKGNGIERIEQEIRNTFVFPAYDQKNQEFSNWLKSKNSIAVHARRGDFLGTNGYCYKYGYFRRAVEFVKRKVNNPVFVFFCDTGSIEWCKKNSNLFGINAEKDSIMFVDWNKDNDSYRDMQLMADCKHNIITESTFGWWGTYLNNNPDKITISPDIRMNTTHWI